MSPRPLSKARHALVTTATIAVVVAMSAATIALAATTVPANLGRRAASAGPTHTVGFIQQLTPPPGAAVLLVAGLIAIRRKRR
jgi:hypothetical protein